jgi:hypothetical protein
MIGTKELYFGFEFDCPELDDLALEDFEDALQQIVF